MSVFWNGVQGEGFEGVSRDVIDNFQQYLTEMAAAGRLDMVEAGGVCCAGGCHRESLLPGGLLPGELLPGGLLPDC